MLKWAAITGAGLIGMYTAQSVADLPFPDNLLTGLAIGAAVGGIWCLILAIIKRRTR